MFMNKLNMFLSTEKEVFTLLKIAKIYPILNLVMLLMLDQSRFYRYSQKYQNELSTKIFLLFAEK